MSMEWEIEISTPNAKSLICSIYKGVYELTEKNKNILIIDGLEYFEVNFSLKWDSEDNGYLSLDQ